MGTGPVRAAESQASVREIQALNVENTATGLTVRIRSSAPVPVFRCYAAAAAPPEVILDLPGFGGRLQSRYEMDGHLVREALVEAGGDPRGLRIRFRMGEGSLAGLEQTETGLAIRFARAAPADDPPPDSGDYRIGVGDKLEISVFGHEDLNRTVDVRADGSISYPLIGDLRVVGKVASEVDNEITKALGKDYLVDPQVAVEIKESQTQWVTVLGEIRNPGKFILKRGMRVLDLIADAGGPTKEAGGSVSIMHRDAPGGESRQIVVERDKLFAADNQDANLALVPGDIVTLGEKEVFYIRGEVTKPGPYFLDKGMTVLKAITFAGGFSQFANRKDVVLLRSEGDRIQQKLNVNLKRIEEGKAPDIALKPNDLIIVPRRVF